MTRVITVLLSVQVPLFVLMVYLASTPPTILKRLCKIPLGATRADVCGALGEPSGRYNNDRDWAYESFFSSSVIYVSFDHDGAYVRYAHEL
jgi:hypothetical protein